MGALWVAPRPGRRRRRSPASFRLVRAGRPAAAGAAPTPGGSRRRATTGRRSSAWRAAAAGCRCTSGSPWVARARGRLARRGGRRLARIPGSTLVTPRGRHGDAGHLPDRGLAGRRRRSTSWGRERSRSPRTIADDRRHADPRGLLDDRGPSSTGSPTPCELLAGHTPETIPPRRTLTILGSDDRPIGSTGPPARVEVRRRGWFEVRWRQFRHAPRPVFRAVVDEPHGGDRARGRVPRLRRRPRPRRTPPRRRPAAAVPHGLRGDRARGGRADHLARRPAAHRIGPRRATRTPWSAALGLFAAVPIAYLVLVVLHEIVKPLLP